MREQPVPPRVLDVVAHLVRCVPPGADCWFSTVALFSESRDMARLLAVMNGAAPNTR